MAAALVLDASVVVRWFLADEPWQEQALRLRDRIALDEASFEAPGHLPLELAASLVRAARRGRFPATDVVPALDALTGLGVSYLDLAAIAGDAAALALELGLSAHDAAYLVVSTRRSGSLVTADRQLYEVAAGAGYDVAWLGDLPAR